MRVQELTVNSYQDTEILEPTTGQSTSTGLSTLSEFLIVYILYLLAVIFKNPFQLSAKDS